MKFSLPKAWRQEAGDTLIEVTIALSILSMVLISSSVIAAQSYRLGQTARERTAVSAGAQGQMESVRAFRDNSTWDQFLNGTATYKGIKNAGITGSDCQKTATCFHMEGNGSTPTLRPVNGRLDLSATSTKVPTAYSEISVVGPTAATPNSVEVTVNYYWDGLGGGKNMGHITTTFTNLQYVAAPPPPPPAPPCSSTQNDIVLVVDSSGSMLLNWGGGLTRLDKLKEVAKNFVGDLQLSAAGNHLGLVKFNSTASILQNLTSDPNAVINQINNLDTQNGTKYAQGISAAKTVLTSAQARAGAKKIMVFLSDGLDNDAGTPAVPVWDAVLNYGPYVLPAMIQLPANTDVYTVGITADADNQDPLVLKWMVRGAGTYAGAQYDYQLQPLFDAIAAALTCV